MKRCSKSHEKIWKVYQVSNGCPVFSHTNFRLFRSSLNLRGTTKKVGTFQSDHEASSRWWFQTFFIFTPILFGEDFQFDDHIFQMGWNHQPVMIFRVAKASRDPESISSTFKIQPSIQFMTFFINPIVRGHVYNWVWVTFFHHPKKRSISQNCQVYLSSLLNDSTCFFFRNCWVKSLEVPFFWGKILLILVGFFCGFSPANAAIEMEAIRNWWQYPRHSMYGLFTYIFPIKTNQM